MPAALYPDVRLSLIFVGVSLSFGLLCSIFSSVFLGLQRYAIPTILSLANKILFTAAVLTAVYFQRSLAFIGALKSRYRQYRDWHSSALRRGAGLLTTSNFTLRNLDLGIVKRLLAY